MTALPTRRDDDLVAAINRYGRHDQDCEQSVYTEERPCSCGFNQMLRAAFAGEDTLPMRPTVYRRPKPIMPPPTREELLGDG